MKTKCQYILWGMLILTTCWFISVNYFQLMLIQGNSMAPSYHHMQIVVLDKRDNVYQPGDVVAFRCDGLSAVLVKRVAAVSGETVIIEDGTLFVNEKESPFYENGAFSSSGLLSEMQSLSEGEYIVIGDNIKESKDSRDVRVGIVHADDIIGKIL